MNVTKFALMGVIATVAASSAFADSEIFNWRTTEGVAAGVAQTVNMNAQFASVREIHNEAKPMASKSMMKQTASVFSLVAHDSYAN